MCVCAAPLRRPRVHPRLDVSGRPRAGAGGACVPSPPSPGAGKPRSASGRWHVCVRACTRVRSPAWVHSVHEAKVQEKLRVHDAPKAAVQAAAHSPGGTHPLCPCLARRPEPTCGAGARCRDRQHPPDTPRPRLLAPDPPGSFAQLRLPPCPCCSPELSSTTHTAPAQPVPPPQKKYHLSTLVGARLPRTAQTRDAHPKSCPPPSSGCAACAHPYTWGGGAV